MFGEAPKKSDNLESETTTPPLTKTRIFVGGLGEGVTEDEVKKIFSSVGGSVESMEIVRTKGRSMAYIDFSPSSDKSIHKLFSTYNGCLWKGGRLRLERAKEHYLTRLKREWDLEEDARKKVAEKKQMEELQNPKKATKSSLETKQIRVFFTKLSKMRSLQLSGTGKHKYSFARVQVPSSPIHFCDCEEHSASYYIGREKQASDVQVQDGGMNYEELNMMNSVMNKLFAKENASNVVNRGTEVAKEEDNSSNLMNAHEPDEKEEDFVESDEDGIVINVVTRGNKKRKQQTDFTDQELITLKRHTSEDVTTTNSLEVRKENIKPSKKKMKSLLDEESNKNVSTSAAVASWKDRSNESRSLLEALPTKTESNVQQSTTSLSWSQKCSWKELVGNRDNKAFSVSHILPSGASTKEEPKLEALNATVSPNRKTENFGSLDNKLEEQHMQDTDDIPKAHPTGPSIDSGNETENLKGEDSLEEQHMQDVEDTPEAQPTEPCIGPDNETENLEGQHMQDVEGTPEAQPTEPCVDTDNETENLEEQHVQDIEDISETQTTEPCIDSDDETENFEDQHMQDMEDISEAQLTESSIDSENDTIKSESQENLGQSDNMQDAKDAVEAQPTKPTTVSNKSGRGAAWLQKSSWTQLVTEKNTTFSISQVLPGVSFKNQELPQTSGIDATNPADSRNFDLINPESKEATGKGPKALGLGNVEPLNVVLLDKKQNFAGSDAQSGVVEQNPQSVVGNIENGQKLADTAIGETCLFMRSADSLKEWANAKAALSVSIKKNQEKNNKEK